MKCVIMQPTYLPWAGYFNLISQADIFVFLDDVQYEKSSWQSRNRIILNNQSHLLSVPVQKLSLSQTISTIKLDDRRNWRTKHFKTIEHAYSKHPYQKEILMILQGLFDKSVQNLSELNICLIQILSEHLELSTKFLRASDLNIDGKRSEHIFKICEYLNCNEYLSPIGSKQYLQEDKVFEQSKIKLLFQEYEPMPYPQLKCLNFISHLSIIDVVANIGWQGALEYIQNGKIN